MARDLHLILLILPTLLMTAYLMRRAIRRRPTKWRLSEYFLGGGRIGPTLTRANALGSNFALANGFWYFVVLGYLYGAMGITAQITWCIALSLVGFLVPTILGSARRGETLHGFLGYSYGSPKLRIGCAFVTATGYLLNFGFETYISGTIMASVLGGDDRLKWVFVLALVLSSAIYISISGFLGNLTSDTTQNRVGIITMLLVTVLTAVTVFMGSSATGLEVPSSVLVGMSVTKLIGIIAYTSFFNMVDISNWQSVAANKFIPDTDAVPTQKRVWNQTAVIAFLFPGVIGVALGWLIRSNQGIPDTQLFGVIFSQVIPFAHEYIRLAVFALCIMGFFLLAIGYAENILSAAQFTLMADVFRRKSYDKIVRAKSDMPDAEDSFVRGCQQSTFVIAVGSIAIFLLAMWFLGGGEFQAGEGRVFNFMFIIFGSATSMFPALLLAVLRDRKGLRCDDQRSRKAALTSVCVGYMVAMLPLVYPSFAEISPVFTIFAAAATLLLVRGTPLYVHEVQR